jgi:hypothetical protein
VVAVLLAYALAHPRGHWPRGRLARIAHAWSTQLYDRRCPLLGDDGTPTNMPTVTVWGEALAEEHGHAAPAPTAPPPAAPVPSTPLTTQPHTDRLYTTLDEMATSVGVSKRTLQREISRPSSQAPRPVREGGGGKPALWLRSGAREWLKQEYGFTTL